MDCTRVQEQIMQFVNGQLPEEELEEFVEHIDSCKECYEELQISYSLYWGLKMLEREDIDSFHIQHALDEFMEKNREKIRKKQLLRRLLRLLAVLIVVIAVFFFAFEILRMTHPELINELQERLRLLF